jgi:galactokinase
MNPVDRAARLFQSTFGATPAAVASAPGRVNLIGEHVDYHGGHVLPVATPMRTAVAVGPGEGRLRAASESATPVTAAWPPAPLGNWSDYVAGVAALAAGGPWLEAGLAAAVASDVPVGSGLSSSAALEVATVRALAVWAGDPVSGRVLADLAWRAETGFVGMPCGRMDQLASALAEPGSALLINCRNLETREVPVHLDLVLVDSGEPHALRASAYAERRREGEAALLRLRLHLGTLEYLVDIPPVRLASLLPLLEPPLDRRVKHVVNENQRTLLAARALEAGDHASFGLLVNQSHDSLRDLYQCSTPRLDAIVAAARVTPGVLGARMVGAGWGGAVLVVVSPGSGAAVAGALGGRWLVAGGL